MTRRYEDAQQEGKGKPTASDSAGMPAGHTIVTKRQPLVFNMTLL